jgi:hypothetical protein
VVAWQDPLREFRRLAAGEPFGLVSGGKDTYDTAPGPTRVDDETLGRAARIITACGDNPWRWSLMWELLAGDVDIDIDVVAALVELSSGG